MSGVSQVNGDSDLALVCTCRLSGGTCPQRKNVTCQYFCPRESCPFGPCLEARQFSSLPYVPGAFQATTLLLKLRVNVFEQVSCAQVVNEDAWVYSSSGSHPDEPLLIFITRRCGYSYSPHWCSGLGSLQWVWDPSLPRGKLHS